MGRDEPERTRWSTLELLVVGALVVALVVLVIPVGGVAATLVGVVGLRSARMPKRVAWLFVALGVAAILFFLAFVAFGSGSGTSGLAG
jgi:energy-coupling factor transporter transmembrane protein EcfT